MAERRDVTAYGAIFDGGPLVDPPYASTKRHTLSGDGTLRLYGDDGVTVLREERLPATTWNGVAVPFERVDTARSSTPANPKPAPGQVWAPPVEGWSMARDAAQPDGTLTVRDVSPEMVAFHEPYGVAEDIADPASGWRCIGVATPHGRVMVGDGWQRDGGYPFEVVEVVDGESVGIRYDGNRGIHPVNFDARNLWACEGYNRTRYAPARVGERYRWRAASDTYVIDVDAHGRLTAKRGGSPMLLASMIGMTPDGRADVEWWERLDPSAASHAVAPVPRSNEAARAFLRIHDERERTLADASLPTATGAGLDELASAVFGIERRKPTGSAYRGTTEAESDESLRARCMAKLGFGDKVTDGPLANPTIRAVINVKTLHDPARAHRDEVRRAVDRHIAADRGQPFAHARAAALHAWAEAITRGDTVADVAAVHAGLLRYEALRGSRREPSLAAMDVGVPESARVMYERERAAVRVEAVTPPEEPARPTGGASLNGWQTQAHFWERWSQ